MLADTLSRGLLLLPLSRSMYGNVKLLLVLLLLAVHGLRAASQRTGTLQRLKKEMYL